MNKKEIIVYNMKYKNLNNVQIALLFSALVVEDLGINMFDSKSVIEKFNKWSNEMSYDIKRDFSRELNSYSIGNENNSQSIENDSYYKVHKISEKVYKFEILDNGYAYLKEFILEKWNVDMDFVTNHSDNIVETKNDELNFNQIIEKFGEGKYKIPKYQRAYVWGKNQGTSLLRSLIKKYPIGSFLLWEKDSISNAEDEKIYYLIDGQQRTQTLIKIYETPFYFIDYDIFSKHIDLNKKISKENFNDIYKILNDKKISEFSINNILNDNDFIDYDYKKFLFINIKEFCEKITIQNEQKYSITIIINADEKNIIEIFELLNTKGTKLTKFEILASKWAKDVVEIKDELWKNKILSLYNDNKINGVSTREDVNTPAEIFYVILLLSLEKNSPIVKELFKDKKSESFAINNDILYAMLWLFRVWYASAIGVEVLKIEVNSDFDLKMGEFISDKMNNHSSELIELKENLEWVWKEIETKIVILKDIYEVKSIFNSISRNLFISLASQLLYEKIKNNKFKSSSNIQYHIISEIVNKNFSSSTDTKISKDIRNLSYMKEIDVSKIEEIIEIHNEDQKSNTEFDKGFISTAKFIIYFAYKSYTKSKSADFEFDHIFPKQAMINKNLTRHINSIGNCGYLEKTKNAKKRDLIIKDELLSDRLITHIYSGKEHKDFNEEYYKKVIDTVINNDIDTKTKENAFKEFVELREKIIIELFIDQIDLKNL